MAPTELGAKLSADFNDLNNSNDSIESDDVIDLHKNTTIKSNHDESNSIRNISMTTSALTDATVAAGEHTPTRNATHLQSAAGAKNKKLFPQKLWDLINDDRYSFCLRWSDDGEFVYLNRDEFEDSYLKTSENQFHTQKAISFVRQMNMYGFRKVDDCYYENDNFKRDREHLLKNMIRKHTNKNSSNLGELPFPTQSYLKGELLSDQASGQSCDLARITGSNSRIRGGSAGNPNSLLKNVIRKHTNKNSSNLGEIPFPTQPHLEGHQLSMQACPSPSSSPILDLSSTDALPLDCRQGLDHPFHERQHLDLSGSNNNGAGSINLDNTIYLNPLYYLLLRLLEQTHN